LPALVPCGQLHDTRAVGWCPLANPAVPKSLGASFGVVVRGRRFGIVEEHQPLAAMSPEVVVQAVQLRAECLREAIEPVIEALFDLLDTAGVACRGQGLPAASQVDGFLQQRAQGLQVRLLPGRDNAAEVVAASANF
jgi:hypothetical protein